MTTEWNIEIANVKDARKIVNLIHESSPLEQRNLTTFGCSGYERYVEDLIALQPYGCDSVFYVCRSTQDILGFFEIRRFSDSICLNNGATAAAARGLGIYRKLMTESLLLGRKEGYRRAFHDVFFGNTLREFHERIGYKVTNSSIWVTTDIPSGQVSGRIVVSGIPQADTVHAKYGFSQFALITRAGNYQIGRLGEKWFRITNPDLLIDKDALFALSRLDKNRSILCICSEDTVLPSDLVFDQVLGSYRLEGEIDTILSALT